MDVNSTKLNPIGKRLRLDILAVSFLPAKSFRQNVFGQFCGNSLLDGIPLFISDDDLVEILPLPVPTLLFEGTELEAFASMLADSFFANIGLRSCCTAAKGTKVYNFNNSRHHLRFKYNHFSCHTPNIFEVGNTGIDCDDVS